jgi:uncharacterized protein (DUF433 family)
MPVLAPSCIEVDDRGVARIAGTRSKVTQIAIDHVHWGWSPEAICKQYPHLSLAHVHAALAYYFEHKTELDAEIERQRQEAERLREENMDSPVRRRLKEQGLVP